MEIKYIPNAVERMMQRGISPEEVEFVLLNPDGEIGQSRDKYIFYRNIESRRDNDIAVVVVSTGKDQYEVITVMTSFEVKSENTP